MESGTVPSLTTQQETAAKSLLAADPDFQAAVGGTGYTVEVGPWTEVTAEEKEVLVGATYAITLNTESAWGQWWSWPEDSYPTPSYSEGSYTAQTLRSSASQVTELQADLDASMDAEGNFIGGEVVGLNPESGSTGAVEVNPEETMEITIETLGY